MNGLQLPSSSASELIVIGFVYHGQACFVASFASISVWASPHVIELRTLHSVTAIFVIYNT